MNHLIDPLSQREMEVLECISLGMTVNEIADKLFLSPHTVISHRRNLLQKLNANNGACMVRTAIEKGILRISIPSRMQHAVAC